MYGIKKHKDKIYIFIILAAFFLTRLPYLHLPPYEDDMAVWAHVKAITKNPLVPMLEKGDALVPYSAIGPRPVWLYLLSFVNYLYYGDGVGYEADIYPLRLLPVIAGALSVILVYVLGKALYSSETGFLVSLILLFNPIFFLETWLIALQDGPALFFLLLSYLFFIRGRADPKNFVYCGLMAGLAGLTKETAASILPAYLLLLWYAPGKFGRLNRAKYVFIVPLLMFFSYMVTDYIRFGFFLSPTEVAKASFSVPTLLYSSAYLAGVITAHLSLLLFFVGYLILFRDNRIMQALGFVPLLFGVAFYHPLFGILNSRMESFLYVLPDSAISVLYLAAVLLVIFMRSLKQKDPADLSLMVVGFFMALPFALTPHLSPRYSVFPLTFFMLAVVGVCMRAGRSSLLRRVFIAAVFFAIALSATHLLAYGTFYELKHSLGGEVNTFLDANMAKNESGLVEPKIAMYVSFYNGNRKMYLLRNLTEIPYYIKEKQGSRLIPVEMDEPNIFREYVQAQKCRLVKEFSNAGTAGSLNDAVSFIYFEGYTKRRLENNAAVYYC